MPRGLCSVIGGVSGGIVGGYIGSRSSDDDDIPTAGGAMAGIAIGIIAGHFICIPPAPPPPPPAAAAPPPPPPPPPPSPAAGTPIVTLRGTHFDFDKADIKPEGRALLDDAARTMREVPNLRVSIEGHTDALGSDAYNQRLSERRAAAVREYLVNAGIDASRMSVQGFGESKPAATNDTDEGRAQNRRVEIVAQ